jgi:tripartite-type tricarboxylate transporter receptor subunit TctC
MTRIAKLTIIVLSGCVAILGLPISAPAQWPERPVRMIVTFPAGSANDAAARIFADALGRKWGKPVIVEDRPGAEGSIGVEAFVNAHDDHALLYMVGASITVTPLLLDKLPYDVDRDLIAIAATTSSVLTLAVSADLPARDIPELISVLDANPGAYAWTSGPTLPRYVFAAFLKRNHLQMNFVNYRDVAQPQADLSEGRIKVLVTSLIASSSPVQSGKARFLAVINPTRAAALPALQTTRELGHPELEVDALSGIFGVKDMSVALRNRIAADVARICQQPDIRRKLEAAGQNVLSGTAEELNAGIAKQRAWVSEISKIIDVRNAE